MAIKRTDPDDLRTRRLELGFTLEGAAALIGVRPITLLSWEEGFSRPHRDNWLKWCDALSVGPYIRWPLYCDLGEWLDNVIISEWEKGVRT